MGASEWRVEFVRGALRYAVLATLASEEVHGYELLTRLKEHGLGHIKGGAMYPLLRRLEEDGLIAHLWDTGSGGPARKVFGLTPEGHQELAQAESAWREITESFAWIKRRNLRDG